MKGAKGMENGEPYRYDDMIDLPHHISSRHPQMPLMDRAAQFSPFAALTGHEEAVRETARLTEDFAELDEDRKEQIDRRLRFLSSRIAQGWFREPDGRIQERKERFSEPDSRSLEAEMEITYFQPDLKKSGGAYVTVRRSVKKVDRYLGRLLFTDGTALPLERIVSIEGELFKEMEESDI